MSRAFRRKTESIITHRGLVIEKHGEVRKETGIRGPKHWL